jgi:hypothetical protein
LKKTSSSFVLAGIACAAMLSLPGHAQQNIEKLKQMKVATTDLNIPVVPQEGKNAAAIRENLKRVKLPPGFKVELFAVVPDARHMAVAPSTNMLFVGTRKTTVWAVTDRNSDGVADEVKSFAPSLKFTNPNGVCWTKDGFLIVVEHNRVLNFPAAEFFYEGPDVAVIEVVPQGKLVPPEEESLQPRRAHLPRRRRRQALHHAGPALQRAAARQARAVRAAGHRRHGAHERLRRQRARGGGTRRAQLGGHGHQPEGQDRLVHRQPDRRHGRRHPARRAQPHHQGRR